MPAASAHVIRGNPSVSLRWHKAFSGWSCRRWYFLLHYRCCFVPAGVSGPALRRRAWPPPRHTWRWFGSLAGLEFTRSQPCDRPKKHIPRQSALASAWLGCLRALVSVPLSGSLVARSRAAPIGTSPYRPPWRWVGCSLPIRRHVSHRRQPAVALSQASTMRRDPSSERTCPAGHLGVSRPGRPIARDTGTHDEC